jgi:hypothetical protein
MRWFQLLGDHQPGCGYEVAVHVDDVNLYSAATLLGGRSLPCDDWSATDGREDALGVGQQPSG